MPEELVAVFLIFYENLPKHLHVFFIYGIIGTVENQIRSMEVAL